MTVRLSATVPGRTPAKCLRWQIAGDHFPLILIAIMTFVLITSSGTMAMAVNFAYRGDSARPSMLMAGDRAVWRVRSSACRPLSGAS